MKKRIAAKAATTLFTVATIIIIIVLISNFATTPVTAVNTRYIDKAEPPQAPVVVSGDNVYISWWNGSAGLPDIQTDVMFRASTDGGATFGDRVNLSNSSDSDSWRVEIAGEGDNVVVSWWETNQTSETPVARISTDAGETFGPLLMLGANGTIGITEEEGAEGAEEEETAATAVDDAEGGG
jgi:hypothetical protein